MFRDNNDWLANMDKALSACDVMVIVTDDNFVGKGVFVEYRHFLLRGCEIYYCVESDFLVDSDGEEIEPTQELVKVKDLIIENENNWVDYAVVRY
jgi:hypothetical protein